MSGAALGAPARSGASVSESGRSPWWLVLGSALALIVGTGPVIQFSFAVFMKPLTIGLNADRGTLALAPALGLLAMGLVTPLFGWLADRYGARRIVAPCVLATAVAFALLGTTRSVPAFIALYCIGSLFAGGYSPMPFAKTISDRFEKRRGLALGMTMAGIGVGTALVPLLSQAMIGAWGWRVAYVGLGVLIAGIALPATLLALPVKSPRDAERPALTNGATAAEALRLGSFWMLAAAFACVALATAGVMTNIVALLTDRGIAPGIATTALAVGGAALIAGRIASGYLLDKRFAPRVAAAFFASALLGIVLLLVSPAPAASWLATGLIGLGLGAEVDLIAYLICRYLGQRAFGAIYGYLFLAFTLGTAAGPLGMGQSFARTGSYTAAMIGYAVALGLACVLVLRLGAYRYDAAGEPTGVREG